MSMTKRISELESQRTHLVGLNGEKAERIAELEANVKANFSTLKAYVGRIAELEAENEWLQVERNELQDNIDSHWKLENERLRELAKLVCDWSEMPYSTEAFELMAERAVPLAYEVINDD